MFEKIMAKNIPNLEDKKDIKVQEAQRILIKINQERLTLRHIIIKVAKVKKTFLGVSLENLKSSKRKTTCYIQRNPH